MLATAACPCQLWRRAHPVDGAFKTPTLRNVELTGPYFHNGGTATLKQVVEFYNRGGNYKNPELGPDITPLGLTDDELSALTAFLMLLANPRVESEAAPFDHPQLFIPNGHPGNETRTQGGECGQADLALPSGSNFRRTAAAGGAPQACSRFKTLAGRSAQPGSELGVRPPLRSRQPSAYTARHTRPRRQRRCDRQPAITARDANGDRIFYSASGLPREVRMTVNGRLTGRLTQVGNFLVTVVAYDGQLGTASTTFRWTVN